MLETIIQIISAAAAIAAAVLWLLSARPRIPEPGQFPINVARPDGGGPLGGNPLDGRYVGQGNSPQLQAWAAAVFEAFARQSRLSAFAAASAAIAAIFQALLALHLFQP